MGAIVYTLFAWGTVFLLDPEHKRTQQVRELKDNYETEVSNKRMEFIRSIEGEQAIAAAASADIQEMLSSQRNGKKHFGSPVGIPASAPFVSHEASLPPLPQLDDKK